MNSRETNSNYGLAGLGLPVADGNMKSTQHEGME